MSKYTITHDRIYRYIDVQMEHGYEADLSTEEAKEVAADRIKDDCSGFKWRFYDYEPYYAQLLVRVVYQAMRVTA
jgi:hypothetical protein